MCVLDAHGGRAEEMSKNWTVVSCCVGAEPRSCGGAVCTLTTELSL